MKKSKVVKQATNSAGPDQASELAVLGYEYVPPPPLKTPAEVRAKMAAVRAAYAEALNPRAIHIMIEAQLRRAAIGDCQAAKFIAGLSGVFGGVEPAVDDEEGQQRQPVVQVNINEQQRVEPVSRQPLAVETVQPKKAKKPKRGA